MAKDIMDSNILKSHKPTAMERFYAAKKRKADRKAQKAYEKQRSKKLVATGKSRWWEYGATWGVFVEGSYDLFGAKEVK